MTEWLKGCEVCNAGLCARFDELQDEGLSIRKASKVLEDEQEQELGTVLYPAETLRKRHARNKPTTSKVGTSVPKQAHTLETIVASTERYINREVGQLFAMEPWQDQPPPELRKRAKAAVVCLHLMIHGLCKVFDLED